LFITSSSSAPKYPEDPVPEAVGAGVLSVNQSPFFYSLTSTALVAARRAATTIRFVNFILIIYFIN